MDSKKGSTKPSAFRPWETSPVKTNDAPAAVTQPKAALPPPPPQVAPSLAMPTPIKPPQALPLAPATPMKSPSVSHPLLATPMKSPSVSHALLASPLHQAPPLPSSLGHQSALTGLTALAAPQQGLGQYLNRVQPPPPAAQMPAPLMSPPAPLMTSGNKGFPLPESQIEVHHRALLQEFALLSRLPESTWIVALSQTYLHHTQVLEQQRMMSLSQGTSAHSTNPYFDSHRLELINQTRRHIQGFRSMLKYKQPGTSGVPMPAKSPRTPSKASHMTMQSPLAHPLPTEAQLRQTNTPHSDNGYESAGSNHSDPDSPSQSSTTSNSPNQDEESADKKDSQAGKSTVFRRKTRDILEQWYIRHMHSPYVDHETASAIAQQAGIQVLQVRKWLSNRRNRDKNTRHRGYKDLTGLRRYYTYTGVMDTYPLPPQLPAHLGY